VALGWLCGRLGPVAVLCLTASRPAVADEPATAHRLHVAIGQTQTIPMADVTAVMAINERVAQAVPGEGGFTVTGKTTGDTIVQVFTASDLHVYVVAVQPPPPGPPPPPPPPNLAQHGPIATFWADNSYQLRLVDSTFAGRYYEHILSFHGRAGPGEYHALGDFTNGDIGTHLQHGTISWASDRRDLAFDLGDTSGRLFGSSLAGAVGLRGLRANRRFELGAGRGTWGYELFTGELLNAADVRGTKLAQPVVGGSVEASLSPRGARDLRVSLGTSALAFSTARVSEQMPGQSGVVLGAVGRAIRRNGFGLELHSGLSSTTAHLVGATTSNAASFGVLGLYQSEKGSQRVEYELSQAGFVSPQTGLGNNGFQRVSAAFSRTIHGVTASGSAGYSLTRDIFGNSLGALNYRFSAVLPVHRQTSFTLMGGENSTPLPVFSAGGGHGLASWSQTMVGARLDHTTADGRYGIQSEIDYLSTQSSEGDAIGTTVMLSGQRHRIDSSRWDAGGNLIASAAQSHVAPNPIAVASALAVDQAPVNFGVSGSAQARFVQGPFQSFGGLGLQTTEMPSVHVAPTVNLGIQFTPTSAHQLVANANYTRWSQSARGTYSLNVNYTYRFGDSIRAVPLFEFMSYGVVEGRVCYDENSDGVCGADEPPLANVPLVLSNGSRALSDRDGYYRFERVKPGFYHLDVDEGVMREHGRPTTILAASFEMPVRGTESRSFAVARACRVQGHVIHDIDVDGVGGESEPLFGGPLVIMTGAAGTFQARVNAIGTFAATVPCGDYDLEIDPASLPALHAPGDEEPVHVTATATQIPAAKLLVSAIRTVGGQVFLDRNRNGKQDAGEPVVENVVVRLGKRAGRSDETGAFLLRHLPAGEGTLVVDPESLPAGLRPGAPIPVKLQNDSTVLDDLRVPVLPVD
jgi:hypothetical protein